MQPGEYSAHDVHRCLNCGQAAPANFCPHCGQETAPPPSSLGGFLRGRFDSYVTR